MLYGDSYTIAEAQTRALRHLCAALRCALGPPERSRDDAATGHNHVDAAIVAIEQAEKAAANTGDPEPTDAGPDHDKGIFGTPNRVVRVTGVKAGERRGEPLIDPDDGV